MDLEKLSAAIDSAFAGTGDEEVQMTQEEFQAYVKDQVAKAKADEAEHPDRTKTRVEALKAEVERLSKIEYKPGELPAVKVFKDPWQLTPTDTKPGRKEQSLGGPGMGFTAKAEEVVAKMDEWIEALVGKPEDKADDTTTVTDDEDDEKLWPSDLAKGIEPDKPEWDFDPPEVRKGVLVEVPDEDDEDDDEADAAE